MSPPVAPSKWKRAAVALLGIALVGALSAALLRRDRGAPRDTPAAATTTGAMATASAPELPTASDVSVTPSGAVASDVPRALPKGAAGHDPKRARPRGAASSSTGKKDGACNPNYTIDADGVKRFKPECF